MFSLLYIGISFFTLLTIPFIKKKYIFVALFFSAMLFATLALFMTPNKGVFIDTIRFFKELDILRSVRYFSGFINSWRYCLEELNYAGVPFAGIYISLISLLNSNAFLLGITAFIQVFFAYIWIIKIAENSFDYRKSLFLGLFFFLTWYNFMASISGVRNTIAFIVFGYLTYSSFQDNKFGIINWIFSFSLCFFHSSILIFFAIRVFCEIILNKRVLFFFNIVLLLNRFIQQTVLNFLGYFSNFSFVSQIIFKSEQYLGANAYIRASSEFSHIRSLLKLITILIMFILYRKYSNRNTSAKYDTFFISVICFCIGAFFDEILFGRTVALIVFLAVPYFMGLFSKKIFIINTDWKKVIFIGAALFILLVTMFNIVDNARAAVRFVHLSLLNF